MSRGRKDDASLKRLSVYASNIQSPWLWKSARLSLQVVVAVQSPSCVQLFVTHELQHARIQFAGLTVTMCGGQSMQSRGVVQGLGRRSLELLSTCLIKSPKCKFPPMTTHCISDLEIKNFLHSSLAGGLTSSPGQQQTMESKGGPWLLPFTTRGLK